MTAISGSSVQWRPSISDRLRYTLGGSIYRLRRQLGLLPESNAVKHAKSELARLRSGEPDEMQDAIERHVLKMVRTFDKAGHSGFSARYTIKILEKLLRFEPASPLTGDDDEWTNIGDVSDDPKWQNKRCSRVFKGADGRAYDIEGKVFVDDDGCAYTNRHSRVYVTFPYWPDTQVIRAPSRDKSGRFRKAARP